MCAIRVASAALLGAAALALGAPAAVAEDGGKHAGAPFGFGVEPSTITAGSKLTLRLARNDGCKGGATVTSDVFETVRIPSGRSSATTTIDAHAQSGSSYRVTFDCDGTSGSTDLRVADGRGDGGRDSGTAQESRGDGHSSDATVPGAVQAGDGGSLAGFDLGEIGLGTVLIAGSLGTAYRIARRTTRDDA
ncbi:hypothetical protein ACFC09_13025 [Streptomyces sp. NPDC056161]|uniref:hypothetical protein n=1 Tax=Streptomyces sp. NPDC056161 TaxID=3345732 RepID=UPI0035D9B303